MLICKWEDFPEEMQIEEVRPYWELLRKKNPSLCIKRLFDVTASSIMLVLLSPALAGLAIAIKLDSEGPVFYRQERVTQYGKVFRIHKFRTMVNNADKIGSTVTVGNDSRITKVGSKLRDLRLDELPQLIDVLQGNMTFVGTRPEAVKYVNQYLAEYRATLLLPAGITSEASIRYKDEAELLSGAENVDQTYVEEVLPGKMYWNLKSTREFSLMRDLQTMFRTLAAVSGKDYR